MHDLRKKILLESGKTMSRKARSRPDSLVASPISSPAPSRGASRTTSRYASEEEISDDSDYDDSLTNSVAGSDDGEDVATASWTDRLRDRIAELLDRKRSSTKGREATLTSYAHLVRYHYAEEQVNFQLNEIVLALLKCIRSSSSADESLAAIMALMLTTFSVESDNIYDRVYPTLKQICQDSEEASLKAQAIQAMGIVTMCGGGGGTEADELLEFLIEIIESDGHSVEAGDNALVVNAALLTWGFVASDLDDLHEQSERALEAFTEQLDSVDVDVQVAAGANVAAIFEAEREYKDETDKTWDLQYDQHKLVQRMTALARESSKAIAKKDRKLLHYSFNSVLTSIELGKGPGYSTARNNQIGAAGEHVDFEGVDKEYGYREKVRIGDLVIMIDSWSLKARVSMLRSVLGGGLPIQFQNNPIIRDILSAAHVKYVSAPNKATLANKKRANKSGRS
ncbi:interferon-related developmental regulator-domain-containing protein [Xylariaceae sp. FL1019]|nr:interferon-related developmental regulator-domain-containing protein [Xylariaceae sp. FL1019]